MNSLIIFCATYLIIISILYAVFHVVSKHERRHHVRHIATILGTALFAWIVAHFLKNIIAHPRPDPTLALISPNANDVYSFPSGHATFMFALAYAMYSFDKRPGVIILVLAMLTGIARVLAGVHFWYDIVGGAIIGACVAYVVIRVTKHIKK